MDKKHEIGVGIGSTSIIMVFTILCLTTFGVLALVTVDGDYKLTKKNAESITHFYQADSQAEEILAQIDTILVEAGQKTEDEIGQRGHLEAKDKDRYYQAYVTNKLGQMLHLSLGSTAKDILEVSYEIPVDEKQSLRVKMQINEYKMSKINRYTLLEWTLRPGEDWEYEEIEFEDIMIGQ